MQSRFLIGAGMFLAVLLCLAVIRHHHTVVLANQSTQTAATAEVSPDPSGTDMPSPPRKPVVHGLPTSTDAGNLAMEWIQWNTIERNSGYRLGPVSEIESRLPYLQQERQKLAEMSLQDDCARAAQRAEVASMDADIAYFQMEVDNAHMPVGPDPQLVREGEDRAAQAAYDQSKNAAEMAKNCTTP